MQMVIIHNMWIYYTIIYSILIGFFGIFKKKAVEKSNVFFVVSLYSTVVFLLIAITRRQSIILENNELLLIILKSFIVTLSWTLEIIALKNYMISSLQPISSIKVVIGYLAGIYIFHDSNIWWKYLGVIIIFFALIMLNSFDTNNGTKILKMNKYKSYTNAKTTNNNYTAEYKIKNKRILSIVCFFVACILSEMSAILDVFIMKKISSSQMQFWFMLFVSIMSWMILLFYSIKNKCILIKKSDWKNLYIYITAIILMVGDRFLFTALEDPNVMASRVTILKQLSIVISVIVGSFVFNEPNLQKKLICLIVIILGIIIILI